MLASSGMSCPDTSAEQPPIAPLTPEIAPPKLRHAPAAARSVAGLPSGHGLPTNSRTIDHSTGSPTAGPNGLGIVGPENFNGWLGGCTDGSPPPIVDAA